MQRATIKGEATDEEKELVKEQGALLEECFVQAFRIQRKFVDYEKSDHRPGLQTTPIPGPVLRMFTDLSLALYGTVTRPERGEHETMLHLVQLLRQAQANSDGANANPGLPVFASGAGPYIIPVEPGYPGMVYDKAECKHKPLQSLSVFFRAYSATVDPEIGSKLLHEFIRNPCKGYSAIRCPDCGTMIEAEQVSSGAIVNEED